MLDEWGNEIQENIIQKTWHFVFANRKVVLLLVGIFAVVFLTVQIIFLFTPQKNNLNSMITPTAMPSQTVRPEDRKLSETASAAAYLEIVDKTASLSSMIENADLFESALVFPPVNTKVKIEEK